MIHLCPAYLSVFAMKIKLRVFQPPYFSQQKVSTAAFLILLPISLIALIFFVVYPGDLSLQSLFAPPSACLPSSLANVTSSEADLRILLGVLTVADAYQRRDLIRRAYLLQQPRLAASRVDVRFILCRLTTEEQRTFVAMEIMLYDDVIILDCAENVNEGKTYDYLSSLPRILDAGGRRPPYDYVVKTDDDTYYLIDKLSETLRGLPRVDVYLGMRVPCRSTGSEGGFMSGMGYALSWDLVEWVAASELARQKRLGPEDIMVGVWLNEGGRGKNRINMMPRMYDYPGGPETCFRHGFVPDSVAVHKLKDNSKWATTLQYFNVTQGLKKSKLYFID
ncbi:uncharacterized protein LOC122000828 [Zingiber officinale]|uniref:uncharacterized protein LOC122000828 n=1 Tax=Zingiber officinale TaxID=94328 RepID=UPI001C4B2FCF|nr:uncharacterized protein LOC122000828 [Zingiber officinale]